MERGIFGKCDRKENDPQKKNDNPRRKPQQQYRPPIPFYPSEQPFRFSFDHLLHRHAFGQIARLVNVRSFGDRRVIRQKLNWNRV